MTTPSGSAEPIDPDFVNLFRTEPAARVEPEPVEPEQVEPEPAVAGTPADTGRLFRSQGVVDHEEALLALTSDHFGRLKSLQRTSTAPSPETADEPRPADPEPAPTSSPPQPLEDATPGRRAFQSPRGRSISAGAGYLIVIGATLVVGFANALLAAGTIGWPTGFALLVSTTYVALTIRRADFAVAVIVPPLAFAVTALTAGQVFLGSSANSLLNRGVVWFFTLAQNWPWILGSTALAFVIVLVRSRRR